MIRIDDCYNRIQFPMLHFAEKETLSHGSRVSHSSCFNDDGIEIVLFLSERLEGEHEINAHRAADAAIVHLNDLLVISVRNLAFDEFVVDP